VRERTTVDSTDARHGLRRLGFESLRAYLRARPGRRPFRTLVESVVDLCAAAKCSSTWCRIR